MLFRKSTGKPLEGAAGKNMAEYSVLMSKAKEYSLNEEHRMAWKTANEAARIDGISHNMKSAAYAMGDLEYDKQGWVLSQKKYEGVPELYVETPLSPGMEKFQTLSTVVDINSELVKRIYDNVIKNAAKMQPVTEEKLLVTVADLIHNSIAYNDRDYSIYDREGMLLTLPLDYFIENGGVCRNHAAAVLALLQKLRSNGYINGEMRINAGIMPNGGGHAYAEYVNQNRRTWTIDATNLVVSINGYVKLSSRPDNALLHAKRT